VKAVIFNVHDVALLITIFQCLLFSLFLVTIKKGKVQSNVLLAAFLLSQAAIPLDNLINFGEVFKDIALAKSPNLYYVFGLAFWLEAPLLLLYIRSLIYKDFKLQTLDLLYFLPFMAIFIYFTFDWLILSNHEKILVIQNANNGVSLLSDRIIHISRALFRLFCGVISLVELHKYQKSIKHEVANTDGVDLTWLKILVIGFLFVRVDAMIVALGLNFNFDIGFNIDFELLALTSNYAVMFLICILIFFSAGHSTIFRGIDRTLLNTSLKNKTVIKPLLIEKIEQYMLFNKPYLNHLLTLDNLASQLEIPPRTLSTIVNQHFNKNFFEFVNQYRVEESKKLLESKMNDKATMLDIMDKAGFNTKATFNTFFKKIVGKTPTQYRKDYWAKNLHKLGS